MSVKKDPSGRRYAEVQIEVPGTPEEVWKAISTGPGISSWLVPTEFEVKGGGAGKPVSIKTNFGPGMEMTAPITEWNPPLKWACQIQGPIPGSPPLASEWIVEARAGGKCLVRLVQSLFATTDEWDDQLEAGTVAWAGFLRTLQIYLTHFRGQSSVQMKYVVPVEGSDADAWAAATTALGLKGAKVGQRFFAPAGTGVPAFSGIVELYTEVPYDALVRIDKPCPGVAALGAFNCGGPSMVALGFYLYGEQAAATAARETPLWDAWFQKRFPTPAQTG